MTQPAKRGYSGFHAHVRTYMLSERTTSGWDSATIFAHAIIGTANKHRHTHTHNHAFVHTNSQSHQHLTPMHTIPHIHKGHKHQKNITEERRRCRNTYRWGETLKEQSKILEQSLQKKTLKNVKTDEQTPRNFVCNKELRECKE